MKRLVDFKIRSNKDFEETQIKAKNNPENFWDEIAKTFLWKQPWNRVLKYNWERPKT